MLLVFTWAMCEVVSLKSIVYDYLHYGKENAVRSKDLAKALGFRTVRDLQKQIELERAAGAVILSDSHGAGYYLSEDPYEIRRFVNTLKARAKNTISAVESACRLLAELE